MRYYFLILLFLSALSYVSARDFYISDFSFNPTPKMQTNTTMQINITANNTEQTESYNLVGYDNDVQFFYSSETIDANQSAIITHNWFPFTDGNHLVKVVLLGVEDDDQNNNTFQKNVFVESIPDLTVAFIQIPTIVQPNSQISMQISTRNNSNALVQNIKVRVLSDTNSQLDEYIIPSLAFGTDDLHTTNFTSQASGAHRITVRIDPDNTIQESAENNNILMQNYSISGGRDLYINTSDINFSDSIVDRTTQGSVTVHNSWAQDMNNVLVRIYHTTENPNAIILSTFINISASSLTIISFPYAPIISGRDLIIVRVDPFNQIQEETKENNYAEKQFTASIQSVLNPANVSNYISWFNIRNSCFALLSNSMRFTANKIFDAGNNDFRLDFSLKDPFGSDIIAQTQAPANQEFFGGGVTMRILSLSGDVATVLLVFPAPIAISYTTCDTDVQKIASDLASSQNDLSQCKISLDSKTGQINSFESSRATNISTLDSAISAKTNCETEKSGLMTQIDVKENECVARLSTDKNIMQETINIQSSKLNDERFFKLIGFALACFIGIIFSAYIYGVKKGWM